MPPYNFFVFLKFSVVLDVLVTIPLSVLLQVRVGELVVHGPYLESANLRCTLSVPCAVTVSGVGLTTEDLVRPCGELAPQGIGLLT